MDCSRPLGVLDDADVFFMPVGDKLYYMALGFRGADRPAAAAAAFREFLAALPASRWAPRARAHLAELGAAATANAASGASASARKLRISLAVLSGSLDRDARRDAQSTEDWACAPASSSGRCVSPAAPTWSSSCTRIRASFLQVSLARTTVPGGMRAPLIDCLSTVARSWRPLLDAAGRARVHLRLEPK